MLHIFVWKKSVLISSLPIRIAYAQYFCISYNRNIKIAWILKSKDNVCQADSKSGRFLSLENNIDPHQNLKFYFLFEQNFCLEVGRTY